MPKPALPLDDHSLPRFPATVRKGALPAAVNVARYVIAVLDRVDPSAKGARSVGRYRPAHGAGLGDNRLKSDPRPSSADWWGYLKDRLHRAHIKSAKAVRA